MSIRGKAKILALLSSSVPHQCPRRQSASQFLLLKSYAQLGGADRESMLALARGADKDVAV